MTRYVYDFTQGSKDQKALLGGKGANLAEMTKLGLPVPPGFTITTAACREFLQLGDEPGQLRVQVTTALRQLEDQLGRRLGDRHDPLLVSVRSGAQFSMPGMMESVLNVGLNDASVKGLAEVSGNERFAWDSYRRLLQMFGKTVLHMPGEVFADAWDKAKATKGVTGDLDLDVEDLQQIVDTFKDQIREHTGAEFPQHPREQLDLAIRAVFNSWNTDRARLYRRRERISENLGTAVNVCTMVFGNLGETSGTGVAFTRDPATGQAGAYGDYLSNAQGEDVVSGIRNTLSLDDLAGLDPDSHRELTRVMRRLETHYRDLCDIEFTIERGKLWMLQTRVGKRTPAAAFRIAVQLVDEQLITMDEALGRVSGAQLALLMFPAVRQVRRQHPADHGHGRIPRGGRRPGGVRFTDRQGMGRPRRDGHSGAAGDEPGRPGRHDRGRRGAHRPRREDLARRRGGPRDGKDLRVRRRGTRRRPGDPPRHRRQPGGAGGRPDQHRRVHRGGIRRVGPGRSLTGGDLHRGRPGRGHRRRR